MQKYDIRRQLRMEKTICQSKNGASKDLSILKKRKRHELKDEEAKTDISAAEAAMKLKIKMELKRAKTSHESGMVVSDVTKKLKDVEYTKPSAVFKELFVSDAELGKKKVDDGKYEGDFMTRCAKYGLQ